MGRFFLLLVVIVGLAPTWFRTPNRADMDDTRPILTIERLHIAELKTGEVEIAGAWHLDSPNAHFGGYSALVPLSNGTLLALSDAGRMMRFTRPGSSDSAATFGFFAASAVRNKRFADLEAVTRDPARGSLWATYENTNQIERYDARLVPTGLVRPPQMRGWPSNTGPEAIVRLADGRFVVLSEGSPGWFAADLPALLFSGDPVEGARPAPFRFRPPEGYRPVDTALLPDGRVLILLRRVILGLPPRFEAKLVLADPAEIKAGERWSGREIAHLAEPLPTDNYEGLAVEPGDDRALVLWLISDDNKATFQRTLLLKLLWRPNEKARGVSRAPS